MKLSEQWLREWVSPRLDARVLAERLTSAGLEVGSIDPIAPPLKGVIVGRLKSMTPHPTAAQLNVCVVETGRGQTHQVVCGATNVNVGMKVPLALAGAVLAGERKIETTTVQGVESAGMLCSAAELGLEAESDGLLVLDKNARIGVALTEALALNDVTLEVELTPNRGDCLSVAGMAREVAAITNTRLREVRIPKVRVKSKKRVAVKLVARKECPRYAGRVVQNIAKDAVTPTWLRERLRRAGVRSLHPVVDVTNYVLLELGQPMHAFDLAKLKGAVQVRTAKADETLTFLDGRNMSIPVGSLLIADNRGPIALAGIMGGLETAVDANTQSIFLESAFFHPDAIAGRARALGLQTESSQRFERGVDPELQVKAIERATQLILEIAGGEAGPITLASAPGKRTIAPIVLRRSRLARVLGTEIPPVESEKMLKRLGMQVRRTADGWKVVPPSHRFDIRIEEDLIEEVVRLYGYDRIPARLPSGPLMAPDATETRIVPSRLRDLLIDRDYQEVITYSFVDPELQTLIDSTTPALMLANPISSDMAAMRTSLWTGLLQTLRYNRNRQQERIRVFEIGRRFERGDVPRENAVIAGAATGTAWNPQWGIAKRAVDFYDVKADVEELLHCTLRPADFKFVPMVHSALHPGQSAAIHSEEKRIGWVGALHPAIQARLDLERVVLFEMDLSALTSSRIPEFKEISRFPAIRRDLSVVVQEAISAQSVVDGVRRVAGNLLVNLELFDEYRGEGIDSGRKSLALTLTLQDSSRTLREAEVDALVVQVIASLRTELGAELRS
ncbi:MAG: phenylalanine--tRNA ligase subunit beta [Gammaproteobacteria bacterium]|nr:phenylalanine--tRNA ligase subunit beta [Gammaproteobacteria bacterium]